MAPRGQLALRTGESGAAAWGGPSVDIHTSISFWFARRARCSIQIEQQPAPRRARLAFLRTPAHANCYSNRAARRRLHSWGAARDASN
jgi:hypothetical protein